MTAKQATLLADTLVLISGIYIAIQLGWKLAVAIAIMSFAYGMKAVITSYDKGKAG